MDACFNRTITVNTSTVKIAFHTGLQQGCSVHIMQHVLQSPIASVRGTLLKRLAVYAHDLPQDLVTCLLDCLHGETQPKVLRRLLQLLWKVPMDVDDAPRLWEGAVAVKKYTALPEVWFASLLWG